MIKYISILLICLTSFSAQSILITQNSGGVYTQGLGAFVTSSSNFDRAEFLFAAEFADTITLANFGSGSVHSHGVVGTNALVEVFNGTSWINVFTSSVSSSAIQLSSLLSSPISFTGMTISGLRLNVNTSVRQAYHSVNAGMTYTTSVVNAVPEPSLLALFGLGLVGLGFSRRSKV